MKKIALIASSLFSVACYAQNTTVTATVTDGDSVAWANATWTIDFVPGVQFPNPAQYSINGSALSGTVTHQIGTLDSSGALSVTVYDSSVVTPTGSGWRLNICPLSSGGCVNYQFSTAGGSQSISTNLTTLIGQPRFICPQICRGYNTIEATAMVAGSIFYITTPGTVNTCNQYNGSSWVSCGQPVLNIGSLVTWTPAGGTGSFDSSSGTYRMTNGSNTSLTISGIPAVVGRNHLRIRVYGSSSANAIFEVQLNGDTNANYGAQAITVNATTTSNLGLVAQNSILSSRWQPTIASYDLVEIPFYTNTTFSKIVTFTNGAFASNSVNTNNYFYSTVGYWTGTAAVTSVTIKWDGAQTFTSGSMFTIELF